MRVGGGQDDIFAGAEQNLTKVSFKNVSHAEL